MGVRDKDRSRLQGRLGKLEIRPLRTIPSRSVNIPTYDIISCKVEVLLLEDQRLVIRAFNLRFLAHIYPIVNR